MRFSSGGREAPNERERPAADQSHWTRPAWSQVDEDDADR